jgi:hypothetical protein
MIVEFDKGDQMTENVKCLNCGKNLEDWQLRPRGDRVVKFCCIECATDHHYKNVKRCYNPMFLEDKELKAYALGWFVTDGYLKYTHPEKQLCPAIIFSSTDKQLIDDFVKRTGYTGSVYARDPTKEVKKEGQFKGTKIQYSISYSGPLPEYAMSLGFKPGAKTGKEFVPQEMKDDDESFAAFCRGVWDGDGTLGIRKQPCGFTLYSQLVCKNPLFLCCMHYQLFKRGIVKGNSEMHYTKDNGIFVIKYSHNDTVRLGDFMYKNATIKLERKYNNYFQLRKIKVGHDILLETDICSIEGCMEKVKATGLCKTHYGNKYSAEHKEELASYWQENRHKYLASMRERSAKERTENKEEHNLKKKESYERNKEKVLDHQKQYRDENKEERNRKKKIAYYMKRYGKVPENVRREMNLPEEIAT